MQQLELQAAASQQQLQAEQARSAQLAQALVAANQEITNLQARPQALAHSIVDRKVMGKPKSFGGQSKQWSEWCFVTKAYCACVHGGLKRVLDSAAEMGEVIVDQLDLNEEDKKMSRQLYCILVMLCTDRALDIVKGVDEGCGAEAWRRLTWEYEPRVGVRFGALLQSILKREFGTKG